MSTAAESYASANEGNYPTAITDLTTANPAYLNEDYTDGTQQGYDIVDASDGSGDSYTYEATPAGAFADSGRAFSVCTGGVMAKSDEASDTAPSCP
jgi:hypothetical protein